MTQNKYGQLEACQICQKYNLGENGYGVQDCGEGYTSMCLGKDRAIIVLLDKLLKKMDE